MTTYLRILRIGCFIIVVLGGYLISCSNDVAQQKPNIVLIMADDVGTEVLGCYGGTSYNTPNLDRLAETGLKFTNCYSTPKCSPSRVKIMTGRYQFRTTEQWGHIPQNEITFGHVLQSAGYATALAGKWQMILLGDDPDHVRKMGFDKNSVFGWHEGPRYHDPYIWQNGQLLKNTAGKYGPDLYCDFLIEFIKENRNKPFLAYYPMTTAHDISNDLITPPPTAPNGRYQTYKELIEVMDTQIGRLINTLDKLGLRENTLILFTTDNGTPQNFITRFEDGKYIKDPVFSKKGDVIIPGGKGKMTDAGTHVPLIANWSGKTPAGKICADLIDFSDFMPTLADLANAEMPEEVIIDGKSFAAQIQGKKANPREWIFNQYEGDAWVRTKEWKLYRSGSLFNMSKDPLEQNPAVPGSEADSVRKELLTIFEELNQTQK
jgi:arylsulfatase A-like enzyme